MVLGLEVAGLCAVIVVNVAVCYQDWMCTFVVVVLLDVCILVYRNWGLVDHYHLLIW